MAHVMIVDDDAAVLEVVSTLFKDEGYEVTSFVDSRIALTQIQSDASYDILVTDIRMDNVDGLQLIKASRAKHAAVPIIVLSAFLTEEIIDHATELGCWGFVKKPFTPDQVFEVVRQALSADSSSEE